MHLNRIIESHLDTDLYKFTMGQAVFLKFPDLFVKYAFKCRNKGIKFTEEMLDEINYQIGLYCDLYLNVDELNYLSDLRYMYGSYISFLGMWHPERSDVSLVLTEDGELVVNIEGYWYQTIYWEVPLLSIINEVYFRFKYSDNQYEEIMNKCREEHKSKILSLQDNKYVLGKFADFGTRRRFSRLWMENVIQDYATQNLGNTKFVGTSNVYLAMKYDLTPVGTNAHEWYMAAQGIDKVSLAHTNAYMLGAWIDVYRGDLGIALSDCLGSDHFLKDFDLFHSKLWDGVRNDSGDPYEWTNKFIDHYKKMRIDPKTKTFLFSNGLNFEDASKLHEYCKDKVNDSYGIGTFITGVQKFTASWGENIEPLNIVIKMVECNGKPVAKLSDDVGKGMCQNEEYTKYLADTIRLYR